MTGKESVSKVPQKPNILFIMADKHRWDALGISGDWVKTPNIDSVASEGIRFSNCVTNSPLCIPARMSLATGMYPHNTGVWNNVHFTLSETSETWMQAIRSAGYRTSVFGKTHLHPHNGDLRERDYLLHAYGLDDVNETTGPGASTYCITHMTDSWKEKGHLDAYRRDWADRYTYSTCDRTDVDLVRPSPLPLEDYYDVYVGQRAREYLHSYERPEPWFCWVSFSGPHGPWDTPEPYAGMYNPGDMPPPAPIPEHRNDRPQGYLDALQSRQARRLSLDEVLRMRADYAGNITLIDDQIGSILEVIRERGELDNTIIVFTSDHGGLQGDYGLTFMAVFLNGAVRVPMIVRTPATAASPAAGSICSSPVELFDIGPTLAELSGAEIEYSHFALSLCPCLSDPLCGVRRDALSEIGGEIMILNKEWKMALNREAKPYMLFDVERDPMESQNLAGLAEMSKVENNLRHAILERLVKSATNLEN